MDPSRIYLVMDTLLETQQSSVWRCPRLVSLGLTAWLSHAADDVIDHFDTEVAVFACRDKAIEQFTGVGIGG